jgi:hypothetical protein
MWIPNCSSSSERVKTYGLEFWSRERELNPWPHDYKSSALPTELSRPAIRFSHDREQTKIFLFTKSLYQANMKL